MNLTVLPQRFTVWKLPPDAPLPTVNFFSATRTDEELSLVTVETLAPTDETEIPGERGWRAIKVQGPLDFALVGVLAELATPLAEERIPIFVISTFDTDYLLVKESRLEDAVSTLQTQGHTFA